MKIKTILTLALTCMIAFSCKKDDPAARQKNIDDQLKTPPYNELPESRKMRAFIGRVFQLKSVIKNGQNVMSSFPKSQVDNTFLFKQVDDVAYHYGEENESVVFPKKGYPTRYSQPALYQRKSNGAAYLTLTHYLIDSGEPGPIEFEIVKFIPGELTLRRVENGSQIDRVFSVSEELKNKYEHPMYN
ncbi:MAG: hypothetical protein E6Q85_00450 [Thiothrix sp.]|nr:MAG: hypothetical protein E6Q85_00450 [Thiothrix sp.]